MMDGLLIAALLLAGAPDCDLLLTGGRVVDGTGAQWFQADVCVAQGRVAAVGRLEGMSARRRIDATGLVVAPGFIDMMASPNTTSSSTAARPARSPRGSPPR